MHNKDRFIGVWVQPRNDSQKAQVGRTNEDINIIAVDIMKKLKIEKSDIILDVCCGNGLITSIVAGHCNEIYGVDFSNILIEVAKKENNGRNICYYSSDALDINDIFRDNFFDKSYCYFSFQYFDYVRGEQLIDIMARLTKPGGWILIDDIPDIRRRWYYYDTILNKIFFVMERIRRIVRGHDGQDSLGWWWHPGSIIKICEKLNLKCDILEQDKNLPYSYYRFGVLIKKKSKKTQL